MKMTDSKRLLSLLLCIVLACTVALSAVGCSDSKTENESPDGSGIAVSPAADDTDDGTSAEPADSSAPAADVTEVGEGKTRFTFTVTDKDGAETVFAVKTDKETVGDALVELGLIEGEESTYGLYVKKVNGITADYDTDKTYWAFYVNGEYATAGVDSTPVEANAVYSFKVEK